MCSAVGNIIGAFIAVDHCRRAVRRVEDRIVAEPAVNRRVCGLIGDGIVEEPALERSCGRVDGVDAFLGAVLVKNFERSERGGVDERNGAVAEIQNDIVVDGLDGALDVAIESDLIIRAEPVDEIVAVAVGVSNDHACRVAPDGDLIIALAAVDGDVGAAADGNCVGAFAAVDADTRAVVDENGIVAFAAEDGHIRAAADGDEIIAGFAVDCDFVAARDGDRIAVIAAAD